MTDEKDAEREAFERWAANKGYSLNKLRHGRYSNQYTVDAFEAWQASRADMREDLKRVADAVAETIEENAHLADGDVCTLRHLKDALRDFERKYPRGGV